MKKNNYLFYCDYLKDKNILNNKVILVSKIKGAYLIGPLLNENFDNDSFYKRIISNGIYTTNIYKKMSNHKCIQLISKYKEMLSDNEVIELFTNGNIIKHTIIRLPGE